ncbi:carboxypeptidase N subunit 2-like [Acipenser ruthenus]|uniref:carboxypeptidase N subunit 2-like n=1 Tax=Acipenser ruthenus TaxID=7906 RepID=UPI00274120D4|nr:carboxypeptidase N subunit 2-like [Acipenser ruthenus]
MNLLANGKRRMAASALLLLTLWMAVSADGCPSDCTCFSVLTDCRSANLHAVPQSISAGTETLFLADNQITTIQRGAFVNLTGLTFLSLANNEFSFQNDTLEGLNNLLSLDLSENSLQEMPLGFFQTPLRLVWLNIAKNRLKILPKSIFRPLEKLTYLDLSDNSLDLHNHTFEGLISLNTLSLSGNRLKSIPTNIFDAVPKLQGLDLSNNFLTHLPEGFLSNHHNMSDLILNNNNLTHSVLPALQSLSNLNYLYLSGNSISTLPLFPFAKLRRLVKLLLSNNSISALPDGFLAGLNQLSMLDLSGNSLASLPEHVFQGSSQLEYLHLDRNSFSKPPLLSGLHKLQELTMCCCQITLWPEEVAISHLGALELIDLSKNLIAELDSVVVTNNTHLKKVLLTDNPICSMSSSMLPLSPPLQCTGY